MVLQLLGTVNTAEQTPPIAVASQSLFRIGGELIVFLKNSSCCSFSFIDRALQPAGGGLTPEAAPISRSIAGKYRFILLSSSLHWQGFIRLSRDNTCTFLLLKPNDFSAQS